MANDEISKHQEQVTFLKQFAEGKKDVNELSKEEGKLLQEYVARQQKSNILSAEALADMQERIDVMKVANRMEDDSYAKRARGLEISRQQAEVDRDVLKTLRKKMIANDQSLSDAEKEMKAKHGSLKLIEKELKIQEMRVEGHRLLNEELNETSSLESGILKTTSKISAAMETGALRTLALKKATMGLDNMISKLWDGAVESMWEMDQAVSDFNKQFQLGDRYTDRITDSYKAMNEFGVSIGDAAKAQGILTQAVTDYTMMSDKQQDAITEHMLAASRLGVDMQDYSAGMQNSMKMFGRSSEGAIQVQGELAATARALGRDQKAFANEFAQSGGVLAKFGKQGVKAFKDLAHISKITGMEISKVLALTNKFDTFEDAAGMAGKLNAALGGNFVNAMDMMMETDPAARFGMIRDAISDAGLSFNDMSYYQKQFYTESLGLSDVGDLAMMLSGNMEDLAGATNQSAESLIEQKKRAAASLSVQEAWKAIIADNTEGLIKLGKKLNAVTSFIIENIEVIKWIVPIMVGFRAVTLGMSLANLFLSLSQKKVTKNAKRAAGALGILALAMVALAVRGLQMKSPSLLVITLLGLAAAIWAIGKVGPEAAPGIQAVAIPMLQLGVALALVLGSLALVAAAFSLLSAEQMVGLGLGLLMLAGAVLLMGIYGVTAAPGIAAVGIALLPLIPTILAVGAATFLAGVGIGLMGAGMSLLFESIQVDKLIALGIFIAAMVYGAPFILLGAGALGYLAISLAGVAISMALIPTSKMEALAMFTSSLAAIEIDNMNKLAESIERVAAAMDSIPTAKSLAVASAVNAVTTATVVMKAVGFIGPASQSAPTADGGIGGTKDVKVKVTLDAAATKDFLSGKTVDTLGALAFSGFR